MRKIIKYEFSDEERNILADVGRAIDEICCDADDDCYYHGKPCPFQSCCAFFTDEERTVLGDAIKNLHYLFEKISFEY